LEYFLNTTQLTHSAVLAMLSAAVAKAEEMQQPQCIVIVDASGQLLGEIRMTGAKFLSRKSALSKALTAASTGKPSGSIPEQVRIEIGMATGGNVTGLKGGLPIRFGDQLLGAIGVGSGTGDQDVEVGRAALSAIGAEE
jgi:glc operon protein GlcG